MNDTASPRLLSVLLGAYLVLSTVLAFNPNDRGTWFVENLTIWLIVGALSVLYFKGIRFSGAAYGMMSVLIFLHTIGGHYTFAQVPFGWVTDTFGFERNHFDRMAHFSVGFYAFPVAEWLHRNKWVANKLLLATFPVFSIATVAMGYELIEWIFAVLAAPEAGIAFLGSQGDIWDAQKDMLADTLGAITATALYFILRKPRAPLM